MRVPPVFALAPWFCLLLAMALGGCQKAVHGPGLGDVAYTKRQTLVLAAPDAASRTLVSVGVNVEVAVSARRDGFSKVAIDDGRIVGWVESDSLSPTPVRESVAKPRRATPAPHAKPAVTPEAQALPQPAAATPEAPAQPAGPGRRGRSHGPGGRGRTPRRDGSRHGPSQAPRGQCLAGQGRADRAGGLRPVLMAAPTVRCLPIVRSHQPRRRHRVNGRPTVRCLQSLRPRAAGGAFLPFPGFRECGGGCIPPQASPPHPSP